MQSPQIGYGAAVPEIGSSRVLVTVISGRVITTWAVAGPADTGELNSSVPLAEVLLVAGLQAAAAEKVRLTVVDSPGASGPISAQVMLGGTTEVGGNEAES